MHVLVSMQLDVAILYRSYAIRFEFGLELNAFPNFRLDVCANAIVSVLIMAERMHSTAIPSSVMTYKLWFAIHSECTHNINGMHVCQCINLPALNTGLWSVTEPDWAACGTCAIRISPKTVMHTHYTYWILTINKWQKSTHTYSQYFISKPRTIFITCRNGQSPEISCFTYVSHAGPRFSFQTSLTLTLCYVCFPEK